MQSNTMKKQRIKRAAAVLAVCVALSPAGTRPLDARVVAVQSDQVNIRKGAGLTTAVIGKANKDEVYAWQAAADGWTQIISANGQLGYIRNDLLRGYDEIVATGSGVRVRQSPSLTGAVLGSIDKGDRLTVSDRQGEWFKVRYGQADGWISAGYAKLSAPVDLPAASATGQTAPPDGPVDADGTNGTGQGGQISQAPGQIYDFSSVTVGTGTTGGALSGKVITLDPGHGTLTDGKPIDPGARGIGLGIWEKDVNLDIALKLKTILEGMGATVWMTHTGSTYLNLNGRAALANQNGSHLFISIHTNSSEKTSLNGHSVYFYAPAASDRLKDQREIRKGLAGLIQDSMTGYCGLADLGVKESNFVVLRETNCPSALIETAFLSYAQEELLLAQGAFRQRLADAIAIGIAKYFDVG